MSPDGDWRDSRIESVARAYFDSTSAKWNQIYEKRDLYSLLYQHRRKIALSLVDELKLPPPVRALDIGCGPGLSAVALAEREYLVDAVDPVPRMIEMTRKLADDSGLSDRIRTKVCDCHNLIFPDNSFDLVLMVGVTEWMQRLDPPMREVTRVLKAGGVLIVTGDNAWSLHFILDPRRNRLFAPAKVSVRKLFPSFWKPSHAPYYLRTLGQFDWHLRTNGLKKIKSVTFGFGPFSFLGKKVFSDSLGLRIHSGLQSLADSGWPVLRSTGHVYIAVATKV